MFISVSLPSKKLSSQVFHKEYEHYTNIKSCANKKAVKTVNACIVFNVFIKCHSVVLFILHFYLFFILILYMLFLFLLVPKTVPQVH